MFNIFSIILILSILTPLFLTGQWQAIMIDHKEGAGDYIEYKVYSDLNHYRYEFLMDGLSGVVIVYPEKEKTAIIMPDDKIVHYADIFGWMSAANDPVQGYNRYKQQADEKIEGNESKGGYDCVKKSIYQGEERVFTQWFSEELNFPVRIEAYYKEGKYMELKEIKSWEVDPEKFIVPDDYTEVDEEMRPVIPEPPPPDEWVIVEASVPVEMEVTRGEEVIFPITDEVYHKMVITNTGDTPLKFIFHQYENGSEQAEDVQGGEDWRSRRLYMGEKYNMTFNWKAGWEIHLNVYEGSGSLSVSDSP